MVKENGGHTMRLTDKEIIEFWKKRVKEDPGKTWNGDDPKPAFDYHNLDKITEHGPEYIYFKESNWNDTIIKPFKEFIIDIIHQDYDKYGYEYVGLQDGPYHTKLTSINTSNKWIIYVGNLDDQSVLCFYKKEFHEAFQLQQYKRRGRIESFHDFFEKDHSIDIGTFTDIFTSIINE